MIYLDHAATTPLDKRVLEAMKPYLTEHFGNASSVHQMGRRARVAVEDSRERVAELLGAETSEIVFTSGGTESNNAALKGALTDDRPHLITSAAEHDAVLRPAERMQSSDRPVTILNPGSHGAAQPDQVQKALTDETGLVSLMHVNNELGAVTNIPAIAELCREAGARLHCDAVQSAGLYDLDVKALGVDLLSISAHKFYGPKGVGLLYVRGGVDVLPLVEGGSQERDRRGGTENVPAIVGATEALRLAVEEAASRRERITRLRDRLLRQLRAELGAEAFVVNTPLGASDVDAAPHVLNIALRPQDGAPLDGEMLLLNLDTEGICTSAGSACTSGALEPSHVLQAIGLDDDVAAGALRFSLGKENTDEEMDETARTLAEVVERVSQFASVK
jgi:cysteine desulfurase